MAPATRAVKVYDELALPELIMLPAGLVVLSGVALFLLNNLLRMTAEFGSKAWAKGGPAQAAVQPYFAMARPVLGAIFGSATGSGGLKVDLTALLLCAILIVLAGAWRSLHIATQRLRAQQQAKAADGKRE